MAEKLVFEHSLGFQFSSDFGCFLFPYSPAPFTMAAGERYRVVWDGTSYDVSVIDTNVIIPGTVAMGNGAPYGFPGNNEPFIILYSGLDVTFISTVDMEEKDHTVAVYQIIEEDKEYLVRRSTLKGIADAIRYKAGTSEDIAVTDMANRIFNITGGGSDVEVVYVTFMSHDGSTELFKRAVVPGNDCMEVVSGNLIDAPTKESTNTTVYNFAGWSLSAGGNADASALDNVTIDRTVYAAYTAATRYYTVRFFDGSELVHTMQVQYGASANYTMEKEGYQFNGWQPSNTNIIADTDCYAQWATAITFANATWAQIAEISESGEAANYFKVGDTKDIPYGNDTLTVTIAGFNHDNLPSGGKAGISIVCLSVPNQSVKWDSSYNSSFEYPYAKAHSTSSYVRDSLPHRTLSTTVLNALPEDLRAVIKPVTKSYNRYKTTDATLASVDDSLWLLSLDEMGYNFVTFDTTKISAIGTKYALFDSMDYYASSIINKQGVVTNCNTAQSVGYWTRSNIRGSGYWTPIILTSAGGAYSITYSSSNSSGTYAYSTEWFMRFGFCV